MLNFLLSGLLSAGLAAGQTPSLPEVLAGVRIQGNVLTPDAEVLRLAGVEIGMALPPDAPATVADRLRATKRFQQVQVLKRFASIEDASQIILVVLVDEGPVSVKTTGDPANPTRVVRTRRGNTQFLPLFTAEDGYGVSYGGRVTQLDVLGSNSRLSVPGTWGGYRRIAVELEKRVGPSTRFTGGTAWWQRTNPFYHEDDERKEVWVRGERQIIDPLRVGVSAGWQDVTFIEGQDRVVRAGVDATFDTRLEPWLPRRAVWVTARWDRFAFQSTDPANHFRVDARGYLGAFRHTVLVVRALRDSSTAPLPDYLKPLLGGMSNLRGFGVGTDAADTLVSGSLELRAPITSPVRIARLGVSALVDTATVYDSGERFSDQALKTGIGGSIWIAVPLIRVEVAVAHGIGSSTRVHVSANLPF